MRQQVACLHVWIQYSIMVVTNWIFTKYKSNILFTQKYVQVYRAIIHVWSLIVDQANKLKVYKAQYVSKNIKKYFTQLYLQYLRNLFFSIQIELGQSKTGHG